MGYTLRSPQHRLVVWRDYRDPNAEPVYAELFDHENDPQETINIAAAHPDIVSDLTTKLNKILKP
jgi:iduronate 2-sulfatase